MTIRVRRYEPRDFEAVTALNARLEAHGVRDRVWPEAPDQPSLSRGDPLSQEMYVAVDGDAARGGVWLHEHDFHLGGAPITAGWLKYPVAESLIDRGFAGVPAALIVALMRRQPNLMALGMGSAGSPLARLLVALRWRLEEVPFYITPVRPARVLRGLPAIQRRTPVAAAAAAVALSGLGKVGGFTLEAVRRFRTRAALRGCSVSVEPTFGGWAADIWSQHVARYGFVARRDPSMLNHMYGRAGSWLSRLRVARDGRDIGWVCTTLIDLAERNPHPAFGSLRVGQLADAFGDPADAMAIFALGLRHLEQQGADIVFSNQSHPAWGDALRTLAFVRAPGNCFLATSASLHTRLSEVGAGPRAFVNRGDCDGPRWWSDPFLS